MKPRISVLNLVAQACLAALLVAGSSAQLQPPPGLPPANNEEGGGEGAGVASVAPGFGKEFSPSVIGPGGSSELIFSIQNLDSVPITELAFTDVLPAGVTIARGSASGCDGVLDAPAGGATISFSGGRVSVGETCQITVNVTSGVAGVYENVSGDLTSSAGNSGPASANLTVATNRPGFSKSFSPSIVGFGNRSRLTFSIDNTANSSAATSPSFVDELPAGLTIASPANLTTNCPAGMIVTAVPGTDKVVVSGSSFLGAGAGCELAVDVEAGQVGVLTNVSGELFSSVGASFNLSSGFATASLAVTNAPIILTKEFLDDPVAPGSTVDLEFIVRNVSRGDATDIAFTDDIGALLPGLVVASVVDNGCDGSVVDGVGTGLLSFSGGTLFGQNGLVDPDFPNACALTVRLAVPSTAAGGFYPNTTSAITAAIDGQSEAGDPASDILSVQSTFLTKSFTPDVVGPGGTTTMEFTISNTSLTESVSGITFTDNLDAFVNGLVVQSLPASGACGAGSLVTVTEILGETSLQLIGGSLAPNSSCTFSIDLEVPVGGASGTFENRVDDLTSIFGGATVEGPPASALLTVAAAPRLTKAFDGPIVPGGTGTLSFTLSLPNEAPGDSTGIAFTDDLTAVLSGLTIADTLPIADVCGSGSELSGSATSLSLAGGSLSPGETCTFSVTVALAESALPGIYSNTTSTVTAMNAGIATSSAAASDDLLVSGLTLSKVFKEGPAPSGGTILEFTLTNNHPSADASGIFFTDNLSATLSGLASSSGTLTDICGTGSEISGTSFLIFTGGSLAAGNSCTFSVTLDVPVSAAPGAYRNITSSVTASIGGGTAVTPPASAILEIDTETGVTETVPAVTINQAVGQFDPTSSLPIRFTAVFSETVTDFDGSDVFVTYPALMPPLIAPLVDVTQVGPMDGTTYEVAVSGLAGEGPVTATIPAGGAQGAFFPNQASSSTDNQVELTTSRGDVTPPVITLLGNSPIRVECGSPFLDPGATAVDDTDGSVVVSVGGDVVTTSVPGNYAITYDAMDSSGNVAVQKTRLVIVEDTLPPVITLNGLATVTLECGVDSYDEPGAMALDLCEGPVSVTIGGSVDTGTPGTYTITYDASDSVPNAAAQVTRTVIVEDTTPPIISLIGSANLTLECGIDTYEEKGATASDICEGSLPVTITGTVDTGTPGTYEIKYDASDSVPNPATQVIRTVVVVDTTPPVITLEGDSVVCVIKDEPYVEPVPGATATDACDENPVVTPGDANPIDTSTLGDIEITYVATDAAGLTAEVTRTIRIIPRFVTIEGLFGSKKVEVKDSSVVDGGEGEKTLHIVASQKDVKFSKDVSVDGNVTSVTGKTEVDKDSAIGGGIEAGGDVKVDEGTTVGDGITSRKKVDLKKSTTVQGSVEADDDVKVDEGSVIEGGVTSGKKGDIQKGATIHGSVATNDDVSVGQGSVVEGDVSSGKKADLEKETTVNGDVAADDDIKVDKDSSIAGDVVSGGKIELKKDVTVGGDATASESVDLDNGAIVAGTTTEGVPVPPVALVPALPLLSDIALPVLGLAAGGPDVNVPKDAVEALTPGSYGKVEVKECATLSLGAGVYHFVELKVGEDSSLFFQGPTTVNVQKDIEFKPGVQMSGVEAQEILIQCDGDKVELGARKEDDDDEPVKAGRSSLYLGTFLAPRADIEMDEGGELIGALFGEEVKVGKDSMVTGVLALELILDAAGDWGPLVLPLLQEPAMPYEDWASAFGVSDRLGDSDQDGIMNGVEYLLSYHPQLTSVLPLPVVDDVEQTVHWRFQLRPGVDLEANQLPTLEVSWDLVRWHQPEGLGWTESVSEEAFEVNGPLTSKRLFFRLSLRDVEPTGGQDQDADLLEPSISGQ